jgi:hypothetical protein
MTANLATEMAEPVKSPSERLGKVADTIDLLEGNNVSNGWLRPSRISSPRDFPYLRARPSRSASLLNSHETFPSPQGSIPTTQVISLRSRSALDALRPSVLNPSHSRYSTIAASLETGPLSFSEEELISTELSDDEDSMLNDCSLTTPKRSNFLMQTKFAKEIYRICTYSTKRFRACKPPSQSADMASPSKSKTEFELYGARSGTKTAIPHPAVDEPACAEISKAGKNAT